MSVFCNKCKYLEITRVFFVGIERQPYYACKSPYNIGKRNNTWLNEGKLVEEDPKNINKDNNCGWYCEGEPSVHKNCLEDGI
jgi:hypothetical protein